MSKKKYGKNAV